ncbi:MAG TPA: hypothetical protein VLF67_02445 [Candidatus Saccharimonas sp.]|nr:hypothetical protein [Candidatus Saccharimonas sp.]
MNLEIIILGSATLAFVIVVVIQSLQLHKLKAEAAATAGQPKPVKVPEPTVAELEAKLKAAYEAQIAESVKTFGTDLQATSARLGEQVSRLTTTVIEEELSAYHQTLEQVRQSANQAMEQIRQAVEQQRVELRQGMEADMATEKQHMVDKFNQKMGDVVSSYIAESLGGGVDLGAQMQYILASLEAHKEEITKDLLNGV